MNEAIRLVEIGHYVREKGRWNWVVRKTIGKTDLVRAIESFNDVVTTVENRCMAADGPVTPTLSEMREEELRKLWLAVQEIKDAVSG